MKPLPELPRFIYSVHGGVFEAVSCLFRLCQYCVEQTLANSNFLAHILVNRQTVKHMIISVVSNFGKWRERLYFGNFKVYHIIFIHVKLYTGSIFLCGFSKGTQKCIKWPHVVYLQYDNISLFLKIHTRGVSIWLPYFDRSWLLRLSTNCWRF